MGRTREGSREEGLRMTEPERQNPAHVVPGHVTPHLEVVEGSGHWGWGSVQDSAASQALSQPLRMPWAGTGQVRGQCKPSGWMKAAVPSRPWGPLSRSRPSRPFSFVFSRHPTQLLHHQEGGLSVRKRK